MILIDRYNERYIIWVLDTFVQTQYTLESQMVPGIKMLSTLGKKLFFKKIALKRIKLAN